MNDNNEIWKNALEFLENANNKTAFNLWIKPITVKFDGNTAYLFFTNSLSKNIAENMLRESIEKAIKISSYRLSVFIRAARCFLTVDHIQICT